MTEQDGLELMLYEARTKLKKLERQRDELLAALEDIATAQNAGFWTRIAGKAIASVKESK